MTGAGPTGDGGLTAGAADGASGMVVMVPPEGLGPDMNTGEGDLPLMVLLRPLRRLRSPSRKV